MTEFSGGSAEPKNSRPAPTRLCFILTTSSPTPPPSHPQDVLPADVATGTQPALICFQLICCLLYTSDAADEMD